MDASDTALPATGFERDDLVAFFATYGQALGSRDLELLGERHAFPGLHVAGDATTALAVPEDVLDVSHPYDAWSTPQEIVGLAPRLGVVTDAGDGLLWAEVRWAYLDENGSQAASSRVFYLLRRGYDGFEVCVVAPADRG